MAKTASLVLLINSLSRTEKRYFKLQTALQKGPKDYLHLFTIIVKAEKDEVLKKVFLKTRPKASYETTVKHLYKVLTDCLLRLRMQEDKSTYLMTGLLKVDILFERSLYEEGFHQLEKIQSAAEEFEQYIVQLWAATMELNYLSNLNFHNITEPRLIQKQMKVQELLKYARTHHQHTSLYELLRHRVVHKGNIRTEEHKRELNDLVISEIGLVSNPVIETFETQKIHLLFQAQYFIAINDYKPALKAYYELNSLLEEHQHLWIDSPLDYLFVIEGILQSLRAIRQYNDLDYFIRKLQQLKKNSVYLQVMIQKVTYVYEVAGLLDRGEFKKVIRLKENSGQTLFKNISVIDPDKQAEVYLYTALIYFSNKDMGAAHHYLSKVLLDSRRYYNLPIYQTFRLIHLLVQYELNNDDFIEAEIRSVRRGMKNSRSKTYQLEKIIFRFIRLSPGAGSSSKEERSALWQPFQRQFEAIMTDKYEIQILRIFDFSAWIESKICKTDFGILLRNKFTPGL
ncbi:hypothetical protein ACX0G9_23725 [Flavitalea flava]